MPAHEFKTFEDVIQKFMDQYKHQVSIRPSWHDLANTKQKSDEDYEEFVKRWRLLYTRSSPRLTDDEAVRMVISNLRMPLRPYISLGEAPKTFEALYDRISRMKFDYEEGILFTLMDPKKHGNKKIPSQSGTGTGNTNTTGPESNANLVCQNDATRNRNTRSGQALGQQVRNTPNQDYRKVPHTYESNGNNGNYWKNDNGERRRRGPKRDYYPPLLQPIDVVFWNLVETKEVTLPPEKP